MLSGQPATLLPGTLCRTWDSHYALVVADRGEWVLVHPIGFGTVHEYWQVSAVRVIEARCVEVAK